ncbi:hypothetical protein MLD38_032247 [Melastoma candidum]|uniref:Uncharacterized protein n=1 Tax=Melastoma candidum TaxID=119954 RepID=A0ACB9M5A4_9MYRT|nr:hypothetical protein MLD38_032247 [Melastoma candidum]
MLCCHLPSNALPFLPLPFPLYIISIPPPPQCLSRILELRIDTHFPTLDPPQLLVVFCFSDRFLGSSPHYCSWGNWIWNHNHC